MMVLRVNSIQKNEWEALFNMSVNITDFTLKCTTSTIGGGKD